MDQISEIMDCQTNRIEAFPNTIDKLFQIIIANTFFSLNKNWSYIRRQHYGCRWLLMFQSLSKFINVVSTIRVSLLLVTISSDESSLKYSLLNFMSLKQKDYYFGVGAVCNRKNNYINTIFYNKNQSAYHYSLCLETSYIRREFHNVSYNQYYQNNDFHLVR